MYSFQIKIAMFMVVTTFTKSPCRIQCDTSDLDDTNWSTTSTTLQPFLSTKTFTFLQPFKIYCKGHFTIKVYIGTNIPLGSTINDQSLNYLTSKWIPKKNTTLPRRVPIRFVYFKYYPQLQPEDTYFNRKMHFSACCCCFMPIFSPPSYGKSIAKVLCQKENSALELEPEDFPFAFDPPVALFYYIFLPNCP